MKYISILIPAYNEEKTIGQVIDKVEQSGIQSEIIVINNCSTDNTAKVAKAKGVKVVNCRKKGKGYAMETGLKYVKTEITMFIDGDLGIYEKDIIKTMIEPLLNDEADFVKSAFEREGGRVTELVAKPLLQILFSDMPHFEQPLSGIIAGKTQYFKKLEFEKDYGVDIAILIDMIMIKARVKEVHLGRIDNNSHSWSFLPKMAKEVANAILKRAKYTE